MLRGIGQLCNKHAPAGDATESTVWICGTGPSLDGIRDDEITGPRIYLNRAAFVLPRSEGETYWLVADDWKSRGTPGPWDYECRQILAGRSDLYGVFRQPLFGAGNAAVAAPTGDRCYLWHGKGRADLLGSHMTREMVARSNTLYMFSGTASPAIHLAWLMGATKVILAGIDGSSGWAQRLAQYYDEPPRDGLGYAPSRADAENCSERLRLQIEDRSK